MKFPESENTCDRCKLPATKADTFCRNCGALFFNGISCLHHPSAAAKGVCVICFKPSCKKCGKKTRAVFLCNLHMDYEIQEGMARIFGTMDNLEAQRVTAFLTQAGYHPFLYSRVFNPPADLVAYAKITRGYGVGNHPIEEQKVFVPLGEVLRAQETLHELGIEAG
jgi:hypothetical protein